MKEPEEVYVLSEAFFRGFSARHGVDVEIMLVRYENVEDMID
jgi:hypothetical protein